MQKCLNILIDIVQSLTRFTYIHFVIYKTFYKMHIRLTFQKKKIYEKPKKKERDAAKKEKKIEIVIRKERRC